MDFLVFVSGYNFILVPVTVIHIFVFLEYKITYSEGLLKRPTRPKSLSRISLYKLDGVSIISNHGQSFVQAKSEIQSFVQRLLILETPANPYKKILDKLLGL
ncbi:hypothetical protein F4703DRAFT_1794462 [Phycomyces blakesleeanus]|uniref:Uncharacterized protein n=1 Tax=Phycomyces blakesleeanus (strain ATCC 8743b / DSM 1359 / FGSC 10004 / NBRC 33097 / NRRL 1555) TaxID=763407 RepID=A0A162TTF0_PHYB8|nr:hypothetical protein PHYBLDRAFT_64083 [Phycomyces blakesleeanus NRRL 1555(-)]OAD70842.1 hypothetical protein PHYBLDRAFT_64083 [Phycomyces blakesleeanus NRRL 1555(-)]|eukprot:XP_018288882.1 hypothetical protein PHYBLDRAFT_64083 [Phycomyces blakesleeanus NRRL 1555(-)]